ncbi:MAG: response regulator [Desulfovibrio sp.]|nr:response regulator [Desulfovibrio sp.]
MRNRLIFAAERIRANLVFEIDSEITLLKRMANSAIIRGHLADPSDAQLKKEAFAEFSEYRKRFESKSVGWVSDADKKVYMNDYEPYVLNPVLPHNYWYYLTLYETENYNFNVNENPVLGISCLWLNAPVWTWVAGNRHGKPLGMVTTPINLPEIVAKVFSYADFDWSDERFFSHPYKYFDSAVKFYFINSLHEIVMSKDLALVNDKAKLNSVLVKDVDLVISATQRLWSNNSIIMSHGGFMYVICRVPNLDWFLVGCIELSAGILFNPTVAFLFFAALAVILSILVAFNVFVSHMGDKMEEKNHYLNQALKEKNVFLARISHEIRTPMNVVIGMGELASINYGKPIGLEYIAGIREAGKELLAIINDILDFSKIKAGGLQLNPAPYEMGSLLHDVLNIVRSQIAGKPIKLETKIKASFPTVLQGDHVRVRQILMNLLGNAAKYTDEGRITLSIDWEQMGENVLRLTISVADTGIGIKQEDIPKLFGDFVRIPEKRNREVEGTGLGLAITRNLCQFMDGDISVSSEYGKGSVFVASLMQTVLDWRPADKLGGKAAHHFYKRHPKFTAPDFHVLVVDDVATNLKVVTGLLAPYQVPVDSALSGEEALRLVQEKHYDLVFMDHMMPDMDGIETTAAIRALGGDFLNLPIVALTGNAVSGMRELFLESGFNDFLSKPVEMKEFIRLMRRWVPVEKRRESAARRRDEIVESLLCSIHGLDCRKGLLLTGGEDANYRSLLETYCDDMTARVEFLSLAQAEADLTCFVTQAHAVKTASANVGAQELAIEASILEDAGRRGDMSAIRKRVELSRKKLTELVEHIRVALQRFSDSVDSSLPSTPPEGFASRLRLLESALDAENVNEADKLISELGALRPSAEIVKFLVQISDLILVAEFGEATALTGKLAAVCEARQSLKAET